MTGSPGHGPTSLLLKDSVGFALVTVVALAVGIAANAISTKPISLVYKPPAEKLSEAVSRGETTLGMVTTEIAQEMASRPDVIVLDARPFDFYELGHIPGAKNLSREEFDKDFAALEAELRLPGKTLLVYCSDSGCEDSEKVAKRLEELGFPKVSLYVGGFQEWEDAGLPTEGWPMSALGKVVFRRRPLGAGRGICVRRYFKDAGSRVVRIRRSRISKSCLPSSSASWRLACRPSRFSVQCSWPSGRGRGLARSILSRFASCFSPRWFQPRHAASS